LSNLQLRVISALVMAVVVLGLTWLGGLPFRVLSAAIAAAIFFEWCAMARTSANAAFQWLVGAFLAAVLLALVAGYSAPVVLAVLGLALIAALAVGLLRGQGTWTGAGLAYAGLSALSIAFLRGSDNAGLMAILFLFAVVWATDILAYFVGRAIGGPKLAPSISPGKTWSGAIGGTLGGMAAGLAVASVAGNVSVALLVGVALFLSVVSQIGDLFESWIKRRHGVKDSGRLIPGHGGVMDRVDGLVVAGFALYLICVALGGIEHPAQGLFSA
jgi:phosphatidate cytidylyltransferase